MKVKVSNCCKAEISYGLVKIGGLIRCTECDLICILLKVINDNPVLTGNYWIAICQDCLNGILKC